ncbi:translation initiation factor IF-2 subunit gamma [Candidatus Pacearchaeota archaeon]|nr:translation initiation factor IF-2 subunit gamma [Candidatus Pacearchaeota archaeon]
MANQKSEIKSLPEINVGVVGHIDHGKTTLLSKLTGKFTDTHSEELKRGITIKLGYTEITIYKHGSGFTTKEKIDGKPTIPVRYVSFIDTPGHEMLMATMLSGAAIIDAAILVVAANEGIKPQTREHFIALQAKGIKSIIVVQNKIDLVSKEEALKNYKQIKEFLKGTFAENAPVIPVSAQQEINLDKILEQLVAFEIPKRDADSNPIFVVARSFDINKPGTDIKNLHGGVLGGILKKGKLKVGDEIEIKPGMNIKKPHGKTEYKTLTTKILSLQKGKESLAEIYPGISLSIETSLDPFLTRADSLTGCMVSLKGKLPEITNKVKINSKLFGEVFGLKEQKKIEPIKTKELLMLSINTTITVGVVENVKSSKEGNEIELSLNIPVIALKGDKAGIARNIDGHWRLIGWGEIN